MARTVIVLHSFWDTCGKLHLWAESSTLPAIALKRRGQQSTKPRPHPFVVANDPLREVIGDLSKGLIGQSASSAVLPVLLPSTRRGPLPSRESIQEDRIGDSDEIALTPWDINTLALGPDAALDFLISLPSGPPHGVAFSSSLRFWVEAAKFSLEMITRQCCQ